MSTRKFIKDGIGLPKWSNPISHAVVVNQLYVDLFPKDKLPARTVYEAAALPLGGKVKIVATAVKG